MSEAASFTISVGTLKLRCKVQHEGHTYTAWLDGHPDLRAAGMDIVKVRERLTVLAKQALGARAGGAPSRYAPR
jgi:hypothetical protein